MGIRVSCPALILRLGFGYDSLLPDILCALERGRVLAVDTTLLGELEQFLLNTVVARSLFALRRALRLADSPERLRAEILTAFGVDEASGRVGQRRLATELIARLDSDAFPTLEAPASAPWMNCH